MNLVSVSIAWAFANPKVAQSAITVVMIDFFIFMSNNKETGQVALSPLIYTILENNLEAGVVDKHIYAPVITPYIAVVDEEIVCATLFYAEAC